MKGEVSMTLTFYRTASDPRDVPKELGEPIATIEGSYRDEPDVIRPVIRVNGHFPMTANEVYIDENNRYYHIDECAQVTKDITDIHLTVDVLQSWYNLFKNAPIIAARSSSGYNTYIVDGKRLFYAYDDHEYITVDATLKNGSKGQIGNPDTIVMVTVG
jgi:hypothetical protein